jgi:hypothetical protein
MNEKIKELALQAGGSHYPDVGGKTLEKFAELIVKECAKRSEELGQPELGKGLVKHFGVEE